MNEQWITASTPSVECYHYVHADARAMVFRLRGDKRGYTACIAGDRIRCAQERFAALRDAQSWAEHALTEGLQEVALGQ